MKRRASKFFFWRRLKFVGKKNDFKDLSRYQAGVRFDH